MSKRKACICVGVSNHTDPRLSQLSGAEVDARLMFDALTDPYRGEHDPEKSVLLVDPDRTTISDAIADLAYDEDVDMFTFFFAGHGGVSNEAYALCAADTNCDRFIATALPVTELFQILNDAKPRHSNIIIDACQAAGMVADLPSILRPTQLGKAQSASISIFATSAADRGAEETDAGGVGTRYLLDCINGTHDCKVSKPYLSLDDMGSAIGGEFGEQSPSVWSFNLSGISQFARNPKAGIEQNDARAALPWYGSSDLPALASDDFGPLWRLYAEATEGVDVRELQTQIEAVAAELLYSGQQARLIIGLSESFAARTASSQDCFSVTEVLCAFLFAAQKISDETMRDQAITYLLDQVEHSLCNALEEVSDALSQDFGLLAKGGAYAEFFCLPLRISQVAAWFLLYVFLAEDDATELARRRKATAKALQELRSQYFDSFSLMSEEQAPHLFVISELADRFGFSNWSEEYISTLYSDFFTVQRRVAKTYLHPEKVFSFLRWRCGDDQVDGSQFTTKPSELLFILLHHFTARKQMDVIRYDFEELDHTVVGTFVPERYDQFADERIAGGSNIQFHIGFDIFTAGEFEDFVTSYLYPAVDRAAVGADKRSVSLALLASLIYPDRVPWLIAARA